MNAALIEKIIDIEFEMFTAVNNQGGKATCQDDRKTFEIMRISQFEIYNDEILQSWLEDLRRAEAAKRNLMTEKYARMMEYTFPTEYEQIKGSLPEVSDPAKQAVEEIAAIYLQWDTELEAEYPAITSRGRGSQDTEYVTSKQTYLKGELSTYSERTLYLILKWLRDHEKRNENLAAKLLLNTVNMYGYENLEDAEAAIKAGKE